MTSKEERKVLAIQKKKKRKNKKKNGTKKPLQMITNGTEQITSTKSPSFFSKLGMIMALEILSDFELDIKFILVNLQNPPNGRRNCEGRTTAYAIDFEYAGCEILISADLFTIHCYFVQTCSFSVAVSDDESNLQVFLFCIFIIIWLTE
ncbi:Testis-expressed protein [Dirofilaria immitis]